MAQMKSESNPTLGPIVGILCLDAYPALLQEVFPNSNRMYGFTSYIAASYIKWLEAAGARVVPIWINQPKAYYVQLLRKINGVLFPGSMALSNAHTDATWEEEEEASRPPHYAANHFVQSSLYIFEIAKTMNERGDYLPIWGTCLGMHLLIHHSANAIDIRSLTRVFDECKPVHLAADYEESLMFQQINSNLKRIMTTTPIAYHNHRFCITHRGLRNCGIDKYWHILATNKDAADLEYASIIEHTTLPFFGVQFHPEKVRFEQFPTGSKCNHTHDALLANDFFAKFFVNECRKSRNHFSSMTEELELSMYNFKPIVTDTHTKHWMQCYFFEDPKVYGTVQLKDLMK